MSNLPETSIGHGQSGGTSTVLGLDNLVTTELNSVHESIVLVVRNLNCRRGLADEGDNGLARVSTNDGDVQLLGVGLANNLSDEGLSTNDVESGDTKETLRVEDALGLENLGSNGNGRVDGVGDDQELGLGSSLSSGLGEVTDDGGVGVEEIVTGHTGLAGNTSGDEDNLSAGESLLETGSVGLVTLDGGLGVDVRDVSSNT